MIQHMRESDSTSWQSVVQQVMDYHVPQAEPSVPLLGGAALGVLAGSLLVFRGAAISRLFIAAVAAIPGAIAGYFAGEHFGVSPPLATVAGLVLAAALAFRTYRIGLALATTAIALAAATAAQMDRRALVELLVPTPSAADEIPTLTRPSPRDAAGWSEHARAVVRDASERIQAQVRRLGPRGPLIAALVGTGALVLALRGARLMAAVWLGAAGAAMTVAALLIAASALAPELRAQAAAHPQYPFAAALVLWAVGFLRQARRMLPGSQASAAPPASPPAKAA